MGICMITPSSKLFSKGTSAENSLHLIWRCRSNSLWTHLLTGSGEPGNETGQWGAWEQGWAVGNLGMRQGSGEPGNKAGLWGTWE